MGQYSVCLSVQLAEMLFLGQLLTTALLLKFAFVEACSYYLEVKSTGYIFLLPHPELLGTYTKQPDLVNGKPWYRGTDSTGKNADNAIFFAINGHWHMGPEEWIDEAYTLMYQSGLSECPGNHDSWKVQNSDRDWIETTVTVSPPDYRRLYPSYLYPSRLITWVDGDRENIPPDVEKLVSEHTGGQTYRHYLARAAHNGVYYPGTFMPNEGAVDIVVGGEVLSKSVFQLAIPNFDVEKEELKWRACSQEDGAFSVGQDKYGNSVYICQVREYGRSMFGVYDRDKKICTVPAGDRAISVPQDRDGKDCDEDFHNFSVLMVKEKSSECWGCGPDSQSLGGAPKSRTAIAPLSLYENLGFANTGPDCWPWLPCEARGGLCCPAKMRNGFESCKGVQKGPRCSAGRQYDDLLCPGSCGR